MHICEENLSWKFNKVACIFQILVHLNTYVYTNDINHLQCDSKFDSLGPADCCCIEIYIIFILLYFFCGSIFGTKDFHCLSFVYLYIFFVHSFIHLFICSFIHSFVMNYPFIHSFSHSFILVIFTSRHLSVLCHWFISIYCRSAYWAVIVTFSLDYAFTT